MHALAFRVMRLCRPNLPPDGLLRADFGADFAPDDVAALASSDVVGSQGKLQLVAMNTHMMPHQSRKEERVVRPDTTFIGAMSSPLTCCASCQQVPDLDFSCRAHAQAPSDIIALDGMLELPQSFGTINLGEVCNPVAEY